VNSEQIVEIEDRLKLSKV